MKKNKNIWHKQKIISLRKYLGITQVEMAHSLGTRQQTISEWEIGIYKPRGMSVTLLNFVAERCNFKYTISKKEQKTRKK